MKRKYKILILLAVFSLIFCKHAYAFVITGIVAGAASVLTAALVVGGTMAMVIAAAIIVGQIVLTLCMYAIMIFSIVNALRGADKMNTPSSKYASTIIQNTFSNQLIVPILYGDGVGDGFYVGGNVIWQSSPTTSVNRFLVLGIGECDSITEVEVDGTDINTLSGCSYTFYSGTSTQTPDSRCSGEVKGLRNVCYLAVTLKSGDKVSGNPTVIIKIKGRKIQTWNSTTGSWTTNSPSVSNNPPAVLRDYLLTSRVIGGAGLSSNDIDENSFGSCAEYCNVLISNNDGDFEPRYEVTVVLDTEHAIIDNIQKILVNFNGYFIRSNGKYKLVMNQANQNTVMAFTEDNIIRGSFNYGYGKAAETPNRMIMEWWNPEVTKNAKRSESYDDELDQDMYGLRAMTAEIYGCARQSQASRMAKQTLYDTKINDEWCSFQTTSEAMLLEIGDVISATHNLPEWDAAKFIIIAMSEIGFGASQLVCRAYNSSIYDDRHSSVTFDDWEYGSPANPYSTITDVATVSLEEVGWRNTDGTHIAHITVTWTETTGHKEFLNAYLIQLDKYEDGSWQGYKSVGSASPDETSHQINLNLEIDSKYRVRVKTHSINNIYSDGTTSSDLTLVGKDAPPSDVAYFAVKKYRDYVVCRWTPVSDTDVLYYEIRRGTSWGASVKVGEERTGNEITLRDIVIGTDQSYWIKAKDRSGNYAENAIEGTVSIYGIPFQNIIRSDIESTNYLDNSNLYYISGEDSTYSLRKVTAGNTYIAQSFTTVGAITLKTVVLSLKTQGTFS